MNGKGTLTIVGGRKYIEFFENDQSNKYTYELAGIKAGLASLIEKRDNQRLKWSEEYQESCKKEWIQFIDEYPENYLSAVKKEQDLDLKLQLAEEPPTTFSKEQQI